MVTIHDVPARYDITKKAFLKYVADCPEEAPHRLEINLLIDLYDLNHPKWLPVLDKVHAWAVGNLIFQEMIRELCPYEVYYPNPFADVISMIAAVDDNTNYIYALAASIVAPSKPILCLSNEATAVMLQLAQQ